MNWHIFLWGLAAVMLATGETSALSIGAVGGGISNLVSGVVNVGTNVLGNLGNTATDVSKAVDNTVSDLDLTPNIGLHVVDGVLIQADRFVVGLDGELVGVESYVEGIEELAKFLADPTVPDNTNGASSGTGTAGTE